MKKFLFFLAFFSMIPQAFAANYEMFLPIPLNPAANNPYLTKDTNTTVYSMGNFVGYDVFNTQQNKISINSNIQLQKYLCISPMKDGKPLSTKVETFDSFFYPYIISNTEPTPSIIKILNTGTIDNKNILFTSNILVINNNYFFTKIIRFFEKITNTAFTMVNNGMLCHFSEFNNAENTITKNDTVSIRIQYPINTTLTVWEFFSDKILSNYVNNTEKENFFLLGTGSTNTLPPIKKAIAELLDGTTVDVTYLFQEENYTKSPFPEAFPLPINTAVIRFSF